MPDANQENPPDSRPHAPDSAADPGSDLAFQQDPVDVTDAASTARATSALAAAGEIAVDVEADSMHAFAARLCFVQVGTDEHIFLFDTLAPGVQTASLAALFSDPARIKFFHAAGGDLQYLAEAGVRVANLFDTHLAATLLGWPKVGLADLVRERLGVTLAKEHQQADFSLRPLPPDLRAYIAGDVRYLCEIGRQTREACRTADILEEVELACRRQADEAVARPAQAELRVKIPCERMSPAVHALAIAVAQALHEARLKWAEALDLPMGQVLSNAGILAVAQRRPESLKELSRLRGVRGSLVREHGEELLALIRALTEKSKRGELPPVEPPQGNRAEDAVRRQRQALLKAFRAEHAQTRGVTPHVVLPNALLEELVEHPPRTVEELAKNPYFGDKRIALYGPALVTLLRSPG